MQKENAVAQLNEAIELALPIYRAGGTTRAWTSVTTPMLVAEAFAELEAKAERYNAILTEAVESLKKCEAEVAKLQKERDNATAVPFMWGLQTADGQPYFDECCVGEEAVVQEVATTYNSMADAADHIKPVKLFLHLDDLIPGAPKLNLTLLSAGAGKTASPTRMFVPEEHQEALPFNVDEPGNSTEGLDYGV
ncbi:hypothetical protein [Moellerella wisconsensis]|uniref:hypothetical protein n=1 Tax=Moellerella wisconsensis TaxID=158849 RepID=UPI00307602E9